MSCQSAQSGQGWVCRAGGLLKVGCLLLQQRAFLWVLLNVAVSGLAVGHHRRCSKNVSTNEAAAEFEQVFESTGAIKVFCDA